jgi:PIN domain nuclease of toxin-antitoxin system
MRQSVAVAEAEAAAPASVLDASALLAHLNDELALAERLGVPALTADGEWTKAEVKAEVQSIR